MRRLIFVLSSAFSVLYSGCGSREPVEQHFVFNNGAEPKSLDPALVTGVPEMRIVDALFEGLTSLDPESLAIRPGVAERWELGGNGLVYEFFLRRDARWSDGRPLVAADFIDSWKRVLTRETAASYAYQLYYIEGAEDFHQGRIKDFSGVGVSAPDPFTLRVKLRAPCPYFLELASFSTLMPVPQRLIEARGDRWTLPENIVGNGPFRLKEWRPRHSIVLEKSGAYWDRENCRLRLVTVLPYDDHDTAYKLFLDGRIHWISDLPPSRLEEIKRNPDFYMSPYLSTYFYRFNVTRPPFDDVRVRKAFSMAIDRRLITGHVLHGLARPAEWFCPEMEGYRPPKGLAQDVAAAKRLLEEAGYGAGGRPFPAVEILFNTSETHKKVAESVVQQWKENLGVRVSLRNAEWNVFLSDTDSLNYQISRAGWVGDYADPNTFLDMWVKDGGNNRTGWSDIRYDALLKQAQAEADRAKRSALFREMEVILVEEAFPIMPLYIYVNKGLLSEKVRGWHANIRDFHPLKHISVGE